MVALLFAAVLIAVGVSGALISAVKGHYPGVVLSAWATTTPTIDGTIAPGEWDDADFMTFTMDGHNGTIYVKNDATNLYIAVVITDDDDSDDALRISFNDDHDNNAPENGEDAIKFDQITNDFYDLYYDATDYNYYNDEDAGGSQDGSAASTKTGTVPNIVHVFEFSHPLDSADDDHDFDLSIGDTVGFVVCYWDYIDPVTSKFSTWPGWWMDAEGYGDIIIASPPSPPSPPVGGVPRQINWSSVAVHFVWQLGPAVALLMAALVVLLTVRRRP